MKKKEYINPTIEVFVLDFSYPVCQVLSGLPSGTLSPFEVDEYTPIWG